MNEDYVEEQTEGKVKGKTGSLTALPIIETQAGDVSAFVPTNVISITDGQIFLETSYFNKGLLPAMNPGISVSRVGGAAQTPLIKKLGGGVRIALAQFRELEAFAQFASDLDDASREQLELGQKVTELMKQKQYSPMSVSEMGLVLFAVDKGYLKDVELNKIADFESALISYMNSEHKDFMDNLAESGEHSDEILQPSQKLSINLKQRKLGSTEWRTLKKLESRSQVFLILKKLLVPWKWLPQAKCARPRIAWKWAGLR